MTVMFTKSTSLFNVQPHKLCSLHKKININLIWPQLFTIQLHQQQASYSFCRLI